MGCLETPYVTPAGYYDDPFMYVSDLNDLTNGQDYPGLSQQINGTPFFLRRVCGLNNVAGYFNYYNMSLSHVFSDLSIVTDRDDQFGVMPEKYYPGNGQIQYDVAAVAKATLSSGDSVAYIGWQGVQRFRGTPMYPAVPKGRVRYQTQAYGIEIGPISWGKNANAVRFQIPVDQHDFVCFRVTQVETSSSGIVSEGEPVVGLLAYRFYDYSGQRALSNRPIPDLLCIDTTLPAATGPGAQQNQGVFPVPGLVYPAGGQIQFDAAALRTSAVEDSVQLVFHGFNRIRCD